MLPQSMDPKTLRETVSAMLMRGVRPPEDLMHQLEVLDRVAPAKDRYQSLGMDDPESGYGTDRMGPEYSGESSSRGFDTKGFGGSLSPDTKGWGKNYGGKYDAVFDPEYQDAGRDPIDFVRGFLPDKPKGKFETEDPAGFDIPNTLKAFAGSAVKRFGERAKELSNEAARNPQLPGGYPGISYGEVAEQGLRGPEEPFGDRAVRDYKSGLETEKSGLKDQLAELRKLATGGPPFMAAHQPGSIQEMVQQAATAQNPAQSMQQDVAGSAAPSNPVVQMVQQQLQGPPHEQTIPGLEEVPEQMGPPEPWRMGAPSPGFDDQQGGGFASILKGLQGFSPSTPGGQGLLAASLGMLGARGTYGNFGQALGQGGLAGLSAYNEATQHEDLNKYKQATLDAQERMAGQKNKIDVLQLRAQMGEKAAMQADRFMGRLWDMAKAGKVAEAQSAFDANDTLQALYPGTVFGKDQKYADQVVEDQLRSNPEYKRAFLNKKVESGKAPPDPIRLIMTELYNYVDGKGPAPSQDKLDILNTWRAQTGLGTAGMMTNSDIGMFGEDAETKMGVARSLVPKFTVPKPKGETSTLSSSSIERQAEQETQAWIKQNNITDKEQVIKHAQEVYNRLKNGR